MKEELIEFSRQSLERIKEIDEIIDLSIDDIKDLTDTASDLIKPIKAFRTVYETARKIKFKRFLKSYSKNLEENYKNPDRLTEKMKDYLKSDKNLNFIYDTIDSAFNSKSIICSGILGFLASKVLINQKEIGFKELIFLQALRSMNDYELKCMIKVFETVNESIKNQTVAENPKLQNDRSFCEYTVQKLKSLQIIEEIRGEPGNPVKTGQALWGTFRLSDISKEFYSLIKESGFYTEILTNKD